MIDSTHKERVLALWQRKELTYDEIASEVGLDKRQVQYIVYNHVHRRRSLLEESEYFEGEAAIRKISKRMLILRLLRTIADDDLCKAILDD